MEPLSIWIWFALIFLIIEVLTATFYGLALSLSSAIVALYVWTSHESDITILQGVVFVVASIALSFLLPRYLKPTGLGKPQGMDRYIGETRKLKKVGDDYKVTLDGVDYIVSWDSLRAGESVRVDGFDQGRFTVSHT